MLSRIRTILLHNSHPGNIGASARALKNMGLSQLTLVAPKEFPSLEADARAAHAKDILAHARVFNTLAEALAGCAWVLGCSARQRKLSLPVFSPREAAIKIAQQPWNPHTDGDIAILYGNEQHGLSNEELSACAAQILIPTSDYASLNLAQAVQIISYELFVALSENCSKQESMPLHPEVNRDLPNYETMSEFYRELEKILTDIRFLDPKQPGQLMVRLKRLFARAEIDKTELKLFRGMLTAIQKDRGKGL